MTRILYIHGLDSTLSAEKRTVLETYGQVIAPEINYRTSPNILDELLKTHYNNLPDVIIGSSLGGFVGYWLCIAFGKPALLFNPALAVKNLQKFVPENTPSPTQPTHLVLGLKDDTVPPADTLQWLKTHAAGANCEIKLRSTLGHQIPIDVFQTEVKDFFEAIKPR